MSDDVPSPGAPARPGHMMSRIPAPSSVPAGDVTALILGAGMGLRMGMGPKAFLTYSGHTLLVRAAAAVGRQAR